MSLSRSHEHVTEAKTPKKQQQQEKVEVDTERKEGEEEGKKLRCFFYGLYGRVCLCASVCVCLGFVD